MKYIIGNWKAHKNISEVDSWLAAFVSYDLSIIQKTHVILCPSFPFVYTLKEKLKDVHNVSIGTQDVSAYPQGSNTGEVSAASLVGIADYSIIGHSERRHSFQEAYDTLQKKVIQSHAAQLKTIFCVRGPNDQIPENVELVAYEPVQAIGTGQNAQVSDVIEMKSLLTLPENTHYIYGGSVDSSNVHEYMTQKEIDGVLPGKASLDPQEFYSLIQNAEKAIA